MIFYEDFQYRFSTRIFREQAVLNKATKTWKVPTPDETDRLAKILERARNMPWRDREDLRRGEANIFRAFCLAVTGHSEIRSVFMLQDPEVAAITFGTMR